jgi:hypothetical protein
MASSDYNVSILVTFCAEALLIKVIIVPHDGTQLSEEHCVELVPQAINQSHHHNLVTAKLASDLFWGAFKDGIIFAIQIDRQ